MKWISRYTHASLRYRIGSWSSSSYVYLKIFFFFFFSQAAFQTNGTVVEHAFCPLTIQNERFMYGSWKKSKKSAHDLQLKLVSVNRVSWGHVEKSPVTKVQEETFYETNKKTVDGSTTKGSLFGVIEITVYFAYDPEILVSFGPFCTEWA